MKKPKSKEVRIREELENLIEIFSECDPNKRGIIQGQIESAAFMRVMLEELKMTMLNEGVSTDYKNGENQYGSKRSPATDTYLSMSKNYTIVINQLLSNVPVSKNKESKLEALANLYA